MSLHLARMRKRGLVWLLVGVALYVVGISADRPFVLRGTQIPFGFILMGLGVALLIWDYVQARRAGGDPPTPPT
jgi:hypothetical protein